MKEDLFTHQERQNLLPSVPLAERARPDFVELLKGQEKLFGPDKPFFKLLTADRLPNLILWGPPGTGKTSFASLLSRRTQSQFVNLSAIDTGAKELKQLGEEARQRLLQFGDKTIIFIDEIHRLNRAQQDCLLPFMEKGHFVLVGATTENPSFELNGAVLSRCQVLVFEKLEISSLGEILDRGLKILKPGMLWSDLSSTNIREKIAEHSAGDARRALNNLEGVFNYFELKGSKPLGDEDIQGALAYLPHAYDKSRDSHHDTISAFIKSIRGSDPQAALFYLAKMLKGGEDPLFIARRLVILASEDVGNADPRALQVATSVKEAVDFVGLPEGAISLAQGVTYLACAPKSNRSYMGLKSAKQAVEDYPTLEPPLSIRNAPTDFMKDKGYGKGYRYAHDDPSGVSPQHFLPEKIRDLKFYEPSDHGYEKHIGTYLKWADGQRERKD